MLAALQLRGPDASCHWIRDAVGLAHALLATTVESANEHQPCSLDGNIWITADARIDDRATLRRHLAAAGTNPRHSATDAELILHAYAAWGRGCVQHLLGDFAFAIWDQARQRLYCARDPFGIKPFFYAADKRELAFATDVCGITALRESSPVFHQPALADFLLFGYNTDPHATYYRGIHQLSPAHCLTLENDTIQLRRYWTPPAETVVTHRSPSEYTEQFRELFQCAVSDRLRTPKVGIFLSGGMDSSSIAAAATKLSATNASEVALKAYTVTANRICPGDKEVRYATLIADALRIPIGLHPLDDCPPFDRWSDVAAPGQAPVYNPFHANHLDLLDRVIADGYRVMLCGEGGDPTMISSPGYYPRLLKAFRWLTLYRELYGAFHVHGSIRRIGLRRLATGGYNYPAVVPDFPQWLDQGFTDRLSLRERWRDYHTTPPSTGSRQQRALEDLADVAWYTEIFRQNEGARTPIEVRYPFFDLRVVNFLLSVPQYLVERKAILRKAMVADLPAAITARPKTPFQGDLIKAWVQRQGGDIATRWPLRNLAGYVDASRHATAFRRYASAQPERAGWDGIHLLAPVALDGWLDRALS